MNGMNNIEGIPALYYRRSYDIQVDDHINS